MRGRSRPVQFGVDLWSRTLHFKLIVCRNHKKQIQFVNWMSEWMAWAPPPPALPLTECGGRAEEEYATVLIIIWGGEWGTIWGTQSIQYDHVIRGTGGGDGWLIAIEKKPIHHQVRAESINLTALLPQPESLSVLFYWNGTSIIILVAAVGWMGVGMVL